MPKINYLTREQVRRIDAIAIEKYNIPGVVLMENAGRSASEIILKMQRDRRRFRCAVLCGGGNNGGDGYVIARHLHLAGVDVSVYSAAEASRLSGDCLINRQIIEKLPIALHEVLTKKQLATATAEWKRASVLVDALLGTGFTGEVRPHLAAVINCCNSLSKPRIVAVDLPSGMDCDTGRPSNATMRASLTVTFVAMKLGFKNKSARKYTGKVVVAGIGAPASDS